jgi:transcriptional regulator with XRE-family HTH domain
MIAAVKAGGRSLSRIAEDGGLAQSNVSKFANGRNTDFPEPDTVTGLAIGMGVTTREVIIGAAQGLGFDMRDSGSQVSQFGRMLPPEVDQLSEQSKQAVLTMINALLASMREEPRNTPDDIAATARGVRERITKATAKHAVGQ